MTYQATALLLCLGLIFSGGPIGCGTKSETKEDKKTECSFVNPQSRESIQDTVEYTGRTAAVRSVDIKARVTGFLLDTELFQEGDLVHKGQKLFQIDPTPYEAQFNQAQAQVDLYNAQVALTTANYEQALDVKKKDAKTFSDVQIRTYKAQMDEAKAGLEAAKASLEIYRINKGYSTVISPIDGVVGRRNLTPGNIVIQDQTLLTTIVSLDRLYVYFDMDAPTYAKFHQDKEEKTIKPPITLELPVSSSSAAAQPAQVSGVIDFFNNQFNPTTDTLLVRGVFDNPAKKVGGAWLRPGMFVRVTAFIGQPYKALVAPDQAILSKMGKKYVYVADDDNRVKEVPVVIGQLQEQGLRVIKEGQLTAQDRVIVTRLLDIQPKQQVVAVPLQPSTSN